VPKRGKNWKPPQARRPAVADGAPPTRRDERRAEAERRRKAIVKAAARKRRLKRVSLIAAVLLVAGGVTAYALTRPTPVSAASIERRLLANTGAADAAGCGEVKTIAPYPGAAKDDRAHVSTYPPISSYPSQPPVSGPHAPIPPGPAHAGIYDTPPDIGQAIHALEHGGVIVWYRPGTDSKALQRIKDFFSRSDEQFKVLVAPYDYDQAGGQLESGKDMVLAAWHHLQSCEQPDLAVAFQFVHSYRPDIQHPKQYKGDAPEPTSGV
jgi:hypothetical protein